MIEPITTAARPTIPNYEKLLLIAALGGAALLGHYNYLLFHTLVELVSVLIGLGISVITFNAFDASNGMLRLLGIANGFVSVFGLLHTLAYKGMGVFGGDTADLATQLWITSRYMEAVSWCISVFLAGKALKVGRVFTSYMAITGGLLASIFLWRVFPTCFVEGSGLTPFKVMSEYLIIGIWLVTIVLLKQHDSGMELVTHRYIVAACWANIVSELCFTLYLSVYGISNMIGHLVLFISFYCLYKAVIQSSLQAPYRRVLELEQERRKALEDLEHFFDASIDALMVVDFDGRIIRTNPALEEILGFQPGQLHVTTIEELVHPDDWSQMMSHFDWDAGGYYEIRCFGHDGVTKLIGWSAVADPIRKLFYAVGRDLTQQKETERELLRLDRLNLAGEMAAGISHEIRNPMTTVRGFLQLLGSKKEYERDKEFFSLMIEELDRANAIITEFLAVAKNNPVAKQEKNLNALVSAIMPLIQADALLAGKQVKAELGSIPNLFLDEKELRQLILNLVFNGLEAMGNKGTVTISTFIDEEGVCLAIRDQGPGIPPQIMDKIFNPFFTTKANGTGLGLAVCHRIAVQHQAKMSVETGDTGTSVTVRFPILSFPHAAS